MKYSYLILCIVFFSCSHIEDLKLSDFSRWGYQLQNYSGAYDYSRIKNSKNMIWVIDYQSDEGNLTKDKVEILKTHRNKIISYFSIGEAETYRDYFASLPKDLLIEENKHWEGNYRVKYWDQRWHSVLINYLDKIIDAGFDGVYLDIIDAFDYYDGAEKKNRANQMLTMIKSLKEHALARRPGFVFIQQNGASIIGHVTDATVWLSLIDAIGIESMFFSGAKPMNNPLHFDQSIIQYLPQYREAGKPIFSIEYIDKKDLIDQYRKLAEQYKVVPLAAGKKLDGKMINP